MPMRLALFAFLLGFRLAFPAAAQPTPTLYEVSVSKYLMGTRVEATVRHTDISASKEALYRAFREMERVEGVLSEHRKESEISKINQAAGLRPVKVSRETFEIVQRAKSYAERLEGLFDVSIGPLSTLWGFSGDQEITLPSESQIATLRTLVDFRKITLSEADTTVFLAEQGMKLDLGGIAKGYAIDRAVSVLKQEGIRHFLLNAGGDIYAAGKKDEAHDWRIGVRHPRDPNGLIARFDLSDEAVATSGDYQRYAILDGHRYHHILDPRTGYPAMHCQSVTVLAATAEEADVLATYLFVRGAEKLGETVLPGIPYLIIDADGKVHQSASFTKKRDVQILDRS